MRLGKGGKRDEGGKQRKNNQKKKRDRVKREKEEEKRLKNRENEKKRTTELSAKYTRSVQALCPMTTCFQRQMSGKEKAKHEDCSRLTSTSGHSVHVVVSEVIPSVPPNAFQASVCDEQLVSIGRAIALSGNKNAKTNIYQNVTFGKVNSGTTRHAFNRKVAVTDDPEKCWSAESPAPSSLFLSLVCHGVLTIAMPKLTRCEFEKSNQ